MKRAENCLRAAGALLTAVSLLATCILPITATEAESAPAVVLTEVCFNPAFEENDYGLEASADVFEYVEICNISGAAVSLADMALEMSTKGYDGPYRRDSVLPPDGGDQILPAGETAVIAVMTGDGYAAGLRTATAEDRAAYYERFVAFYGCADRLPPARFYIADVRDNATGEAIEGRFNLANSTEDAVLRVTAGEELLCETHYAATEWNRNGFSLNLTYRIGGAEGHAKASAPYNIGAPTPALVRDNQLTDAGMRPEAGEPTLPLRVMEYNICATDSTQTDTDGSAITMDERIGHAFTVMREKDPDVLALCEINYLWIPRLMEEWTGEGCGYEGHGRSSKGAAYGASRLNRETWDLYNLILWKTDKYECLDKGTFWCSKAPSRPGTFTWDGGLTGDFARAINWVILRDRATGGEFLVLCGHIDAKVSEARRRSAALIVEKAAALADGRPIMLLGDWNANERSSAYAELTAEGFADARYRVPDPADMTLYGTTNSWGGYSDFRSRAPIDHCIITPHNVFVESAAMDPGYFDEAGTLVSADHNAIVLDLLLALPRSESETEPSTEEETNAPTAAPTAAPTEAPSDPATNDPKPPDPAGGCASLVGSAGLLVLMAAAVLSKKRR